MSGMHLEEIKSENLKPIIYTSQSFVIDKNIINDIQSEIPKLNLYKNINNKYPMKMKVIPKDLRKEFHTGKEIENIKKLRRIN